MEKKIAILIPAYNEEKTILEVIQRTLMLWPHFPLIVIDDGSTDNTAKLMENMPLFLLRNEKNQGKDATLLRGFEYALTLNVDAVITLDADWQHNPDDIEKFVTVYQPKSNSLIIGARILNRENAPKKRLAANRLADFFISLAAGQKIVDSQSGFRLYPTSLLEKVIKIYPQKTKFVMESRILIDASRLGYKISDVPIVSFYPENRRESYYRPIKDTLAIVQMLFGKIISRLFCRKKI